MNDIKTIIPDDDSPVKMEHPFPKSVSLIEKCKRLQEVVSPDDTLAIIINADPDSIASALALKRFYWRKVKKTVIYHVNIIKRLDNLTFVKLLKIDMKNIRNIDQSEITKWAIVDSQPHHSEQFMKFDYDIIIDHHPTGAESTGQFVDIKEDYGANCTILTEYLRAADIKPSPRLATALFYGIKTDTDNFVRPSTTNDINAFRYLYQFVDINIIKKIESSEMSRKTLGSFRCAMENLTLVRNIAFIHMGKVNDPDTLVMMADFFLKMSEATWSVVSGIYGKKLIVIFRNAGFRLDAGKVANNLFGELGSAGGHKSAARAEVNLNKIKSEIDETSGIKQFILNRLKEL